MADLAAPQITVQSPTDPGQGMSYSPPKDGVILTRDSQQTGGHPNDVRPQSNGKGFPSKLMRTRSNNRNNSLSKPEGKGESGTGIDPLSKHINERIGASSPNSKSRSGTVTQTEVDDGNVSPVSPRNSTDPVPTRTDSTTSLQNKENREKKNRVSFLGRFLSKRRESVDIQEDEEDQADKRAEGAEAETFSQPLGYIPKFAEPPKYIKVHAKHKREKDFDRVFLAQELRGRTGVEVAQAGGRKINPSERAKQGNAIWTLEFSKDGKYLAAAGEDHIVRLWAVLSTEEDRANHEKQEEQAKDGNQTRLSAPVFKTSPVQEYEGHTSTVLDLSWSKNNFLLSSSMDKTVRLWHASRKECLVAFKHVDFVTSVQFHPRDDRFFLAGSLDMKLRLWSIPDKTVAHWTQLSELITSVAFSPDGKTAIAGCIQGTCIFYETEGLKQITQIQIRSKNKGSKITGIQTLNYPPNDTNGDVKVLITSNDSRVRVFNLRDKSLELKLKGAENTSSQIKASFSDDAKHIISGSDDKKAYIWSTGPSENKDKRPLEVFEAHTFKVTAAIMAPTKTKQLLQASGDPLFDICNPPPVQLIARSRAGSRSSRGQESNAEIESIPHTPSFSKRPEDNPAWANRSGHPNGNIIVTANSEGQIKVFRQDCAYTKRLRSNDNWDTASTFSKKVIHRSASIATRNSRHSARDSLAYPSDRILSWRQSIDRSSGSPSLNSSADTFPASPHRASFARSISPMKTFPNQPTPRQTSASHSHPLSASSISNIRNAPSFASSTHSTSATSSAASQTKLPLSAQTTQSQLQLQQTPHPAHAPYPRNRQNAPLLTSTDSNPLLISDTSGTSDMFYDRARYESLTSARPRAGSIDIDGQPLDTHPSASLNNNNNNNNNANTNYATHNSNATLTSATRSVRSASGASGYETAEETAPASASSRAAKSGSGLGLGLLDPAGAAAQGRTRAGTRLSSGGSIVSDGDRASMLSEEAGSEGERCRGCGAESFRALRKGGRRVLECDKCGREVE